MSRRTCIAAALVLVLVGCSKSDPDTTGSTAVSGYDPRAEAEANYAADQAFDQCLAQGGAWAECREITGSGVADVQDDLYCSQGVVEACDAGKPPAASSPPTTVECWERSALNGEPWLSTCSSPPDPQEQMCLEAESAVIEAEGWAFDAEGNYLKDDPEWLADQLPPECR